MPEVPDAASAVSIVLAQNELFRTAWVNADWDVHQGVLTPDLEFVDHRPASLGPMHGRRAYIEATRVIREMFTEVESRVIEQHVVAPFGSLAHTALRCTTIDGGEVEIETLNLNIYRGEAICRIEFFPPDRLDDALRRIETLRHQSDPSGDDAGPTRSDG